MDRFDRLEGRFEYKYILPLTNRDKFLKLAKPYMNIDLHSKIDRFYSVHTLYFDSFNFRNYYDKLDGKPLRYKIRYRYYPNNEKSIQKENNFYLELKIKGLNQIWKQRISVPVEYSKNLLNLDSNHTNTIREQLSNKDKQILDKIYYLFRRYQIVPVSVVCYQRQAFIGKYNSNVRITFDTNVKVRRFNFDIQNGDCSHYLIPPNLNIMEIKFQKKLPKWIKALLPRFNIINQAYSKFTEGLGKSTQLLQH